MAREMLRQVIEQHGQQEKDLMMIALNENARTTPAVRAEIAASDEPVAVLARRYDVSETTVRRWKRRNAALLHVHLRSQGRSVLVHAGQMLGSFHAAGRALSSISACMDTLLRLPPSVQIVQLDNPAGADAETVESLTARPQTLHGCQFKKARLRLRKQLRAMRGTGGVNGDIAAVATKAVLADATALAQPGGQEMGAFAMLVAGQLIQSQPQAPQVYQELQAATTLPQRTRISRLRQEARQAAHDAEQERQQLQGAGPKNPGGAACTRLSRRGKQARRRPSCCLTSCRRSWSVII